MTDSHGHSHDHHHHHHHDVAGGMSFDQKLEKMLTHWVKHNDDHAATYRDWAEKATAHGQEKVGAILAEIADANLALTTRFSDALHQLDKELGKI